MSDQVQFEVEDKPQDLSMKSFRKVKHIPPPLDLNARTLHHEDHDIRTQQKSPECLPIRKRPLVDDIEKKFSLNGEHRSNGVSQLAFSIDAIRSGSIGGNVTSPSSPLTSAPPPRFSLHLTSPSATQELTPSSATSTYTFSPFSVPPLIPPGLAAVYAPKSPFFLSGPNGFPTPPSDTHLPYPWTSPSAFASVMKNPFSPVMPLSPLPFCTTALLSPAPSSYLSSTSSSKEDGISLSDRDPKRRPISSYFTSHGRSTDNASPSSPLMSPKPWPQSWPTPSWKCFMKGTMIKFLLPNTETPWQKSEELEWKDLLTSKFDSTNPYQYAPNGLTVVKIVLVSRETREPCTAHSFLNNFSSDDYILRLQLAPHGFVDTPEIMAECPLDHPFLVKHKGWCSFQPRMSQDSYGFPFKDLAVGDVCLPPNHPDAVKTPDLSDRLRKFEFLQDEQTSPLTRTIPRLTSAPFGYSKSNSPMSPSKKKLNNDRAEKPKRPMNGFMLFAKKYRIELIQQHPGKDNRAISVLLGEAWKNLPSNDREEYSQRAKVFADEQKKIHPDCWKRKRTQTSGQSQGSNPPTTPI